MEAVPGWEELKSALKMNNSQVWAWIILGIVSSVLSTILMAHVLKGLA